MTLTTFTFSAILKKLTMDKKLLGLMFLFFLSFALFASMVIFEKPLSNFTRAKEELAPSTADSLIFAWPLTTKADATTPSTITVFVRNVKTKPLSNRIVTVSSTLGTFKENSVTSDKEGKAEFHLTSDTPGIAEVTAKIEGLEGNNQLNHKVTVQFE